MYGNTRKYMADMFRGQTPIRRTNPKPGEYAMNKFLSKIPIVGTYINGIANGQKIGSSVANIYNALDEANCFK